MLNLDKQLLTKLYLDDELNPYEIAERLECNHKTIRSYLRKYKIPLRTASEYNFLAKQNYVKPDKLALQTSKSIAAHVAYLCEGWHTEKSNYVAFCNQDPVLIELVKWLLLEVYQAKTVVVYISAPTGADCSSYLSLYPHARIQIDDSRKNPILRLRSGGKMLVRDLVQNAYCILNSLS